MAYLRGLPHDFDDWEQAGAQGWNWSAVLETFKSIETHSEFDATHKRTTHGHGPVWVSEVSDQMHPFSSHFLAAARDLGWPISNNLNGDDVEGIMRLRSTVRDGKRWSSSDAFLRPAIKRPNLKVVSGAMVERISLVDSRATGVRYKVSNRTAQARAKREVILSAGAVNTPQLLQLSGIGSGKKLRNLGIEVIHNLPEVGRGLQDHLGISHFFHANEPTLNNVLNNWFGKLSIGMRYLLTGSGPLSVPINQVGGFVRSGNMAKNADLQVYCNPMSYQTDAAGNTVVDSKPGFLLCTQPCRPTSRGEIFISSTDPGAPPEIQPNSLSTNHDCEMAISACKVLQKLALTPTIKSVTEKSQEPDITNMPEDEMLDNFRQRASTVFHPTSTCRMGKDKSDSVVDARLRVHGVSGLRVVDASAFPNITSGNTNAPTLMLAARAAQLIKQDWNMI